MSRAHRSAPSCVDALKRLRLGRMLPTLPERIALAEKQDMPLEDFLLVLFTDEIAARTAAPRRRAAPTRPASTPTWCSSAGTRPRRSPRPARAARAVEPALRRGAPQRRDPRARRRRQDLPRQRARPPRLPRTASTCRFQRADDLLRLLRQSRLDNSREALMTELTTVDLLIIDDFALEPMTPRREPRHLPALRRAQRARRHHRHQQPRHRRVARRSSTTRCSAQSAVDRFKNNAYDLVIDGESYRARLKPDVDKDGPPPAAPVLKPQPLLRRKRRSRA